LTAPDRARHAADLQLVQRALAGDPRAKEDLGERLRCVEAFVRTIHRRCHRPLAPSACEDLSQDIRARVLQCLHQFRGESKLESWCYQISRGQVLNSFRSESRRAQSDSLEHEPEARAERAFELAEEYQAALAKLGPPDDTIVRLRALEELEFAEIGRTLAMHTGTVKTRYRRALARLAHLVPGRETLAP